MKSNSISSNNRPQFALLTALLVSLCLMGASGVAQTKQIADSGLFSHGKNVKKNIEENAKEYDEPVNPNTFLIRPAEKLTVTFIGAKLAPLTFTVDPEGRIVDNAIGVVSVAGLTLSQAREKLIPLLNKLYNSQSIDIAVSSPREVGVQISGAVERPGLYRAFMSQHVSEVIAMAGGVTESGSRRRIEFRGGANLLTVDLDRAEFLSDASSDPYVYAGSSIFVPVKSKSVISVVGGVAVPRSIELLDTDDIPTLILLAGGSTHSGDAKNAYILNSSDSLKSGAIIVVPTAAWSGSDKIQVYGAVSNPGVHSLPSPATLGSAISLAKEVTPEANQGRITVFRAMPPDAWGAVSEKRYAVAAAAASGKVDLSFPLKAGDSIFVPLRTTIVNIQGEVAAPGIYLYSEGKHADYYIAMAGGFLSSADQTQIMIYDPVAGTTSLQSPGSLIRDGDKIIVSKSEAAK